MSNSLHLALFFSHVFWPIVSLVGDEEEEELVTKKDR